MVVEEAGTLKQRRFHLSNVATKADAGDVKREEKRQGGLS